MKYSLLLPAAALLASPAFAQSGHQGHDMPAEKAEPSTSPPASDPHAGHDMIAGAGEMPATDEVGNVPAPAPPGDHAADAIFGGDVMVRSRKELAYEVGGMVY